MHLFLMFFVQGNTFFSHKYIFNAVFREDNLKEEKTDKAGFTVFSRDTKIIPTR